MNKKYTISIPIQVNFEGNQMSPEVKTIDIEINAESTEEAVRQVSDGLEILLRTRHSLEEMIHVYG